VNQRACWLLNEANILLTRCDLRNKEKAEIVPLDEAARIQRGVNEAEAANVKSGAVFGGAVHGRRQHLLGEETCGSGISEVICFLRKHGAVMPWRDERVGLRQGKLGMRGVEGIAGMVGN
jgi:hypothetical protein